MAAGVRSVRWPPPARLACLAVAVFLAGEGRLRKDGDARSLDAAPSDRGTTAAIGAVFPLALLGPPFLAALSGRRLPSVVGWAGAGIATAGVGLRLASARALGASYTRTLRTRDGQAVLTTGLYAHVRHPGYAGTLSLLLGYALSWQTPAGLLPFLPMIPVYSRRMSAEERLLETELGDSYGRYRRRTRRLLPGIY
jgi:protein-S-isoprenylcysteine O-methyltransferase Ste14